MCITVRIGIIGDYDGRPSHIATQEALKHSAERLKTGLEYEWLPTEAFENGVKKELDSFDGLWCAPGSPYKSMNGAINAIGFARINDYPFLGTCGGFQHAVIEFGRNVLAIKELQDDGFDPYEPNGFITALSCSLIGQTRHIGIDRNSYVYKVYGRTETEEKYNCSFGVNKDFQALLDHNGFKVIGIDENGEARILSLEKNRFFIGTLFQPQLSSACETPHPLITEYLKAARQFHSTRDSR